MTDWRLGLVSAWAMVGIGVAYAITLGFGFARHGLREPIGDPVLAVMEGLTLVSAVPLVTLFAAIAAGAPAGRRALGLAALVFAGLCAGVTGTVHFVELSAVRQLGGGGLVWPGVNYAAELAAWDLFLGLALLLAAPVFPGEGPERGVRRGLLVCGALCLAGVVGPLSGNMRLQFVGVAGYALGLPMACVFLARLFAWRGAVSHEEG